MNPRKIQQLCQHLREEIHGQVDYFTTLWPGYEDADNPESPHRQRTTVNRMLGYALFLGMPTGRKDREAGALMTLRSWQKQLGPLRDIDVIRQWIPKCLQAFESAETAQPAADALLQVLAEERSAILTRVRLDARGLPGARTRAALPTVVARFEETLQAIEQKPTLFDANRSIRQVALPWRKRLTPLFDNQADELIHSFRVTNKRLRFVLELLSRTEGKRTPWGKHLASSARTAVDTHNTLGSLSDLLMVNERLRLQRARWQMEGAGLDQSAALLERGRLALDAGHLDDWFAHWPQLVAEDFIPLRGS
ncbi:MAG: CHAD domain-containing protein [Candidatus Sumerlaeia bacterium]|nr:CHAD domain-containing protein [Candidatus Sumerlaeia bacterium]